MAQWARQLAIVGVVTLLWGGLMADWLQWTVPAPESEPPERDAAALAPTETATTMPSATPTPSPTPSPEPSPSLTHTPVLVNTPPPGQTATAPAASPTPIPTETPAPTGTSTLAPSPTAASQEAAADIPSFAADALPVFKSQCVKCHGGEETEEGLVLTNHADALAGRWNGPVIEPGNVAGSYLVERIESGEMPKKEPRLLPAEIRVISDWIAAGAPDN